VVRLEYETHQHSIVYCQDSEPSTMRDRDFGCMNSFPFQKGYKIHLFPAFQSVLSSCGDVRHWCVPGEVQTSFDGRISLGLSLNGNSPFKVKTCGGEVKFRTVACIFFGPNLRGVELRGWSLSIISSRRGPRDVTPFYLVMLCSGCRPAKDSTSKSCW
jgi:hypothetical protein